LNSLSLLIRLTHALRGGNDEPFVNAGVKMQRLAGVKMHQ
jgi:hypothetical protein